MMRNSGTTRNNKHRPYGPKDRKLTPKEQIIQIGKDAEKRVLETIADEPDVWFKAVEILTGGENEKNR